MNRYALTQIKKTAQKNIIPIKGNKLRFISVVCVKNPVSYGGKMQNNCGREKEYGYEKNYFDGR